MFFIKPTKQLITIYKSQTRGFGQEISISLFKGGYGKNKILAEKTFEAIYTKLKKSDKVCLSHYSGLMRKAKILRSEGSTTLADSIEYSAGNALIKSLESNIKLARESLYTFGCIYST